MGHLESSVKAPEASVETILDIFPNCLHQQLKLPVYCNRPWLTVSMRLQRHTLDMCSCMGGCLSSGCTMHSPVSAHSLMWLVPRLLELLMNGWTPREPSL